jgi:hypothetical protein
MREQHIEFIRKDLKERGEVPTSKCTFFGALYMLKVKKEGDKRAKKVTYSAAKNVLSGYRAILV